MKICIICKKKVEYNGKNTIYTLCSSYSYENLTKEQKGILEKQRKKLGL